eukprot:7975513-Alexandrium_andersonii.AAC.1
MASMSARSRACLVGNTAGSSPPSALLCRSWEARGAGGSTSPTCSAPGVASPSKPGGPSGGRKGLPTP